MAINETNVEDVQNAINESAKSSIEPLEQSVEPEGYTPEDDLQQQQEQDRKDKLAEELEKKEKLKESKKKKPKPILRYYNTDLLIPVGSRQIIPGNYYVFEYSNYKHVPMPIILYIGTNPTYNTMEGISLQYLSVSERRTLEKQLQGLGLHSKNRQALGVPIKNLTGETKHIFRKSVSSNVLYDQMKKKLRNKIYFYRRYKFTKIDSRVFVVPIEAIERAIEINTPIKPIDKKTSSILKKSKKYFNKVINWIKNRF